MDVEGDSNAMVTQFVCLKAGLMAMLGKSIKRPQSLVMWCRKAHLKAACKHLQAAFVSQTQGLHCRWFVFAFLLGEQQTQNHGGYAH